MNTALRELISADIARSVPPAISSFAEALAREGGGSTVAVLFYGSVLRTGDLGGVLDFYVIVDSLHAWHGKCLPSAANWLVPPTVEFRKHACKGATFRAKVAIVRRDQFVRRTRRDSMDTTIWARFAQPSALVWMRDPDARETVVEAVAQAVMTAASWAAVFGPRRGAASEYWRAVFRQTLGAELRVETGERADAIVAFAHDRYSNMLPLAWTQAGVSFRTAENGELHPMQTDKRAALRAWQLRRAFGKPLNVLRLAKASFSFDGGLEYILWKIERHSNVTVRLSPWQRRHPILASPRLLWRLWREGVIR